MEKEMEKEKNIIIMVIQNLKVYIYIQKNKVVIHILMEKQNMKVNIYMIKNGMEKGLMEIIILYMN